MAKPISIQVDREHANAGDVRFKLTADFGEHGFSETFAVPGDVTPFTALRMLGPWLESKLNPEEEPEEEPAPETQPERAVDDSSNSARGDEP